MQSIPSTDHSRWRLKFGPGGSHVWQYLTSDEECAKWPQTDIDRYWLGFSLNLPPLPAPGNALDAARNGYTFLRNLQAPDGHFACGCGGPIFLLPGTVIASYIVGLAFTTEQRLEMIRYLLNTANPDDGGWGLHVEGVSTNLGTTLNYVALRLLGVDADHPAAVKARNTLLKLGGAAAVPSWGKFWMTVLGCYEWEGVNPIPPELWLLPKWLPFHPGRWWVHTRVVYLPMSYLFRVRFQAKPTPLTLALRKEIYVTPYNSIDWPAQCNNIAPGDIYVPHSRLLNFINLVFRTLETCPFPPLQRRALDYAYKLICMEDENTNFQDLAPVSKMMNMICRMHAEGRDSEAVARHVAKRGDSMWLSPDGMLVTGTNGSQAWDMGFAAQALAETGLAGLEENKASALKMLKFLDEAQIRENPKYFHVDYRQATKGAWSFSTKEQGYMLTDCTGEAIKAVLYLQNQFDFPKLISDARIFEAVDLLLSMQYKDGGFGSYEIPRAPKSLEALNSSEVFGNTMVEITYPECTTSVITALHIFQQYHPEHRKMEIGRTVARAIKYLHGQQRADGSWYGSWGICFIYATLFALESLALAGETYANSPRVKRACQFLLSKQMPDGGWGESWESCKEETYVQLDKSQVVQTSWAAMALIRGRYPDTAPIKRAVSLVRSRQLPDGQWIQEDVEGIFNKTCKFFYPNYKLIFTFWMLGLAHKYIEGTDG
ncbi:Terpene cyclase/mutase family member [Mycena venus]|uniref:Terpene cyclase/mutase family member n=1 Tax=Mycena venus TaxID=2733690 RepID=A0A8H7D6Z7_9AGAR|nr:Terpene cyclase/mutase family member [Mycena venus]